VLACVVLPGVQIGELPCDLGSALAEMHVAKMRSDEGTMIEKLAKKESSCPDMRRCQ